MEVSFSGDHDNPKVEWRRRKGERTQTRDFDFVLHAKMEVWGGVKVGRPDWVNDNHGE